MIVADNSRNLIYIVSWIFFDLEPETPLQPGVGDGEEGEEVATEAEEDVERVEDHGQGRGPLVALKW